MTPDERPTTPSRRPRAGLLALSVGAGGLLAAAGCGEAGEPVDAVVVDTVAGVERLTYAAEPAEPLGWKIDTVAVIGEAMGAEEYQFGPLEEDALAGDGERVVVLDRQAARALEYSHAGEHRATYGRRGEGPGELSYGAGVAIGPGDTIWINDIMNRRLTGFPSGGGEPRSVPYAQTDVFPGPRIAVAANGFLQVVGAIGSGREAIPEPLVRLDREGQPVDTLWEPPRQPIDIIRLDMAGNEIVMGMPQTFWPAFHWRAFSDGGAVLADSADYVLRLFGPDGGPRRIVRRQPPARATTEADREAARARERAAIEEGTGWAGGAESDPELQRRLTEQRLEQMTFADRIPRIAALQVDPSDRIWVGVSEGTPGEVERIDLYDADGRLLGELRGVPFPRAFAGEDRILITRTDDLDVPQVVVLSVERSR